MEVRNFGGALGAEIVDVDCAAGLDADTVAEIERAWGENLVVVFRDQRFTTRR